MSGKKTGIDSDSREKIEQSAVINGKLGWLVQIGKVIVKPPKWFMISLLSVVLIGTLLSLTNFGYLLWLNQIPQMGGHLNILVEPFVEKGVWGYTKSDLGWNIAQVIAEDLKSSLQSDETSIKPTVWGPSDNVPGIRGFTEGDLEEAAQKRSEQMNAQILIYGFITEDKYGDPLVSIRIYMSPTNFGDAQDLINPSILGELSFGSFRLTGDTISGTDLLNQNRELRERVSIFSLVLRGLGAHISQDYERAKEFYIMAADPKLWNNRVGLEVVYLLSGNSSIRQMQILLDDLHLDAVYQMGKEAAASFQEATKISNANGGGAYARAYLGLAGVESIYAIAEARINNDIMLVDKTALERQEEFLQLALDADNSPLTADVNEKVAYNRAQISLINYYLLNDQAYLAISQSNYQSVISAFKNGNKRLAEFAALSYSGLATLYWIQGIVDDAVSNYMVAFETSRNPAFKAQILLNIGRIYDEQGNYQAALEYYRDAIARKIDLEKVVKAQDIEEIEKRIQEIENGGIQ